MSINRIKNTFAMICWLGYASLSTCYTAPANAEEVPVQWQTCAACHGAQGQGQGMFPKLAGQTPDYLSGRLTAYKNKEKVGMNSSMMWGMSAQLSDQDIKALSEYISTLGK